MLILFYAAQCPGLRILQTCVDVIFCTFATTPNTLEMDLHTKEEKLRAFGRLLDVLDELREKCPWDRKQTNESLRPNTIEEVYELSDALEQEDIKDTCKELGDVLLHVCFYAKIASVPAATLPAPILILGYTAYMMQLYFDFSGYSDMAIGLGRIFGFHFIENFNYPYISASVTEFWRRWHMSLGSWFRDYVYIPLGGSKKGEGRTYLNLLVVWLFTGLWHGSTLNFLLWGLFLFALISLERLGWGKVLRRSQVISRLYMLLVIPLSWMLFAIPSLKDIGSYIGRLFAFSGGTAVHARDFLVYGRQYTVVLVIGLLVSTPLPEKLWRRIRTSPLGTVLLLVLFWVCVYCMAVATNDPFMYFSF